MSGDRSWMYKMHHNGLINPEFYDGLDEFIEFATSNPSCMEGEKIRCPCDRCNHCYYRDIDEVKLHIQQRGFTPDYYVWNRHGESDDYGTSGPVEISDNVYDQHYPYNPYEEMATSSSMPSSNAGYDQYQTYNPYQEAAMNVGGASNVFGYDQYQTYNQYHEIGDHSYEHPSYNEEQPNPTAQKWYNTLQATEQPLYDGCESYTQLSATAEMLSCKSDYNMSVGLFDRVCGFLKSALPEGNTMPKNFYSTKKLVQDLGLPCEKIHCCINGCMLYWGSDIEMRSCKFCNEPRFKRLRKKKDIPVMVMYYFPITERLQRLYASQATAEHMTWHAVHPRGDDGAMIHPSDSEAWKHFDKKYPAFAYEKRNVRLGLCTDGFSPFGKSGKQYSSWPVILTPYNLPPGMCMKTPYLFISTIILGPRNPKQKLDVFLQPLIEELRDLWYEGVTTWDISTKTNFEMHAALMWTISDFPAYSMLSGWSTAGKLACPVCMEDSQAFQLVNGGKTSWFDTHRKFLPEDHSYRRDKKSFRKNKTCNTFAQRMRTGEEILNHINAMGLMKVTKLGWEQQNAQVARQIPGCGWKKRSIFWDLPYWKNNLIPHNLDVMHIERNVFDNVFNTVMNVSGKTKDNVKARQDMIEVCNRKELEMDRRTGKYPKACYQLDTKEKVVVCEWVKNLRFPDAYVSNMSRCVDMSKNKLYGMKSHDCHVFMQRLIPIAFRELLPKNVWEALTELSIFFRKLTATTLKEDDMRDMEKRVPITICNLEKIFPPAFFDSMEHLPIHLAYEARVAGPVQYRWMYPFERFLGHLKKKISNKDKIESCISNAYLVEESSTFCSYYFEPHVPNRRRKTPRNDAGEMSEELDENLKLFTHPGKVLGKRKVRYLEEREKVAAHTYILLNCPAVKLYVSIFIKEVEQNNPGIRRDAVDHLLDKGFAIWFAKYVHEHDMPDQTLVDIAIGPYSSVTTYPGYYVNGFKFHTTTYGANKSTVNDGVWCKGDNYSETTGDYYGRLIDVVILDYPGIPTKKAVLFKCNWFDPYVGTKVDPRYKLVEVDQKRTLKSYEPFIFASQATQVYFVPYPSLGRRRANWLAVCHTKARPIVEVSSSIDIAQSSDNAFQDDNANLRTISFADEATSTILLNDQNGLFVELHIDAEDEEDSPEIDTVSEEDEDEDEEKDEDSE